MSLPQSPLEVLEYILLLAMRHDSCNGGVNVHCSSCAKSLSLVCRSFLPVVRPKIWASLRIRCGSRSLETNTHLPKYDAEDALDFLLSSTQAPLLSFVRSLTMISPSFPPPDPTQPSRRDRVPELMALFLRLEHVALYDVVLDTLPMHHRRCNPVKHLEMMFCSSSFFGMNAFMSHFCDLDVLRISWPGPPIGTRSFFETREVAEHPALPWPISDRQNAPEGTLTTFKKVYIRSATSSNTFEWFNNPAAWYDPTAICSVQYHAEIANVSGLNTFLELTGHSIHETWQGLIGSPGVANLSTLRLTTDFANMEQTYHSLQSLSSQTSIHSLTIAVCGCEFQSKLPVPAVFERLPQLLARICPWLQDFSLVYEAGAYNQHMFARLTWIISALMRSTPVVVFMQHRQDVRRRKSSAHLAQPYQHLLKEDANLVSEKKLSPRGKEIMVINLDKEAEDRLLQMALQFQTLYDIWTAVSL
ncbi:hypothetical protein EV421DRAFT_1916390 [Armillaria borealis]|uniref:Uncharacterized protein n=1 Tax=Armillaria borealis TaxID=47425 RepID=A0AA39M4R3_9AGAR|nr:hypothetical protein EV421DRAFT_1916390 [Armillaria borealis]